MESVFNDIVCQCDGMLSPAAYQRIYETARIGGLMVEVGTALGAGTVALALGLKDSGRDGRVISFDPMHGGPRRQISGTDRRLEHIRTNLRHFGVDELVELVPAALPEGASALPDGQPISVLMLDADGRIDRDLLVLYERLQPGATLIIDDCVDKVRLHKSGGSTYRIDAKMRLVYLLVEWLERQGFLIPEEKVKDTCFAHKPFGVTKQLDPAEILEVYRKLVFTTAHFSSFQAARHRLIRLLEAHSPSLLQQLRLHKRRSISVHPR